jgi:hypothetical protein
MKKTILGAIIATTLFACSAPAEKKADATLSADPHQIGLNYDSSANINAILATNKDMENLDSTSYKTKYADTAVFFDNGRKTNLKENLTFFSAYAKNNVKLKVTKLNGIFEGKFNFKDNGTGDYVYQYIEVNFTQGTKSVDVHFFQVDEFKEGKIIREWNFYDPTNLAPFLK